jgi:hypothetical protein
MTRRGYPNGTVGWAFGFGVVPEFAFAGRNNGPDGTASRSDNFKSVGRAVVSGDSSGGRVQTGTISIGGRDTGPGISRTLHSVPCNEGWICEKHPDQGRMTTTRGRGWPREHELPYFDGQVHFPDYRIEYEFDRREHHEDIELFTPHYVGAHAASRATSSRSADGVGVVRGFRSPRRRPRHGTAHRTIG